MKSALCSSTLLWAIRAVEKPRKKLYHGVFIAEVISALPHLQHPPPAPAWGPGSGFPEERSCHVPSSPIVPTAQGPCECLFWGQPRSGHCSISGAVGQGRHHRGSPLCITVARCSCKALFLQGPLEKIDIWWQDKIPPSFKTSGPHCRAMLQGGFMLRRRSLEMDAPTNGDFFPTHQWLKSSCPRPVASGDSQLPVTSLRYTLLPPGGTKKSCRRKN